MGSAGVVISNFGTAFDSSKERATYTIDRILYAPKSVSSDRILVRLGYNTAMTGAEIDVLLQADEADAAWDAALPSKPPYPSPPSGATLVKASKLNLSLPLDAGFRFLISRASFRAAPAPKLQEPCLSVSSYPVVQFHRAGGPTRFMTWANSSISKLCMK